MSPSRAEVRARLRANHTERRRLRDRVGKARKRGRAEAVADLECQLLRLKREAQELEAALLEEWAKVGEQYGRRPA